MIPVENAAGGAAFVFHNQPERAEDEHADQIAHIKQNADQKKMNILQNSDMMKRSQPRNEQSPEDKYLVRRLRGSDDIGLKGLYIDFLKHRAEAVFEKSDL